MVKTHGQTVWLHRWMVGNLDDDTVSQQDPV
jgi:hypothetical protein